MFHKKISPPIHPLFEALLNKTPEDVEKMIDKGADVNMKTLDGGKTPLHVAVHRKDQSMVKMLLRKKADVMAATDSGFTPLHVAAQNNVTKIIELLVAAGASVNAVNKAGCTPLHEASAKGLEQATLKLLELKADLNARDFRYNLSAANLAMQQKKLKVGTLLWSKLDYQESFIQTINLRLFNYTHQFKDNLLVSNFLKGLVDKLKSLKHADEVFQCLNLSLKSEDYTLIKSEFKIQRNAIIALMNQYNENKLAASQKTEGKLEKDKLDNSSSEKLNVSAKQ